MNAISNWFTPSSATNDEDTWAIGSHQYDPINRIEAKNSSTHLRYCSDFEADAATPVAKAHVKKWGRGGIVVDHVYPTFAALSVIEILKDRALIASQVSALAKQIGEMRQNVDALAKLQAQKSLPETSPAVDATGDVSESEMLRHNLNGVADSEIPNLAYLDAAKDAIAFETPSVRVAAARALVRLDPQYALEILPDLIAREENKAAKRVLEGALRAARL